MNQATYQYFLPVLLLWDEAPRHQVLNGKSWGKSADSITNHYQPVFFITNYWFYYDLTTGCFLIPLSTSDKHLLLVFYYIYAIPTVFSLFTVFAMDFTMILLWLSDHRISTRIFIIYYIIYIFWWMVLTILKNNYSSMGRIIPYIMDNKIHVPVPTNQNWFYDVFLWIWVNYNISLTWIKAIWGWFPLLTMISSEVVVRSL